MTWNQVPKEFEHIQFSRICCPICGSKISSSDPYGQMELSRECLNNTSHYRRFSNIFVSTITILGKSFDAEDILVIDLFLDIEGNHDYKESRGMM